MPDEQDAGGYSFFLNFLLIVAPHHEGDSDDALSLIDH